jgi:hypothetical protein
MSEPFSGNLELPAESKITVVWKNGDYRKLSNGIWQKNNWDYPLFSLSNVLV